MKKFIIILFFIPDFLAAQNTFKAVIRDAKTGDNLIGASAFINSLRLGSTTNDKGELTITNIPNGKFGIEFTYTGYETQKRDFSFPNENPNEIFEIDLEQNAIELGEVMVSITRSSRSIKDIPTKVDVLAAEDLD